MEKEKKLEIDITYNIEKIDSFFDEEKINEFVSYILKDEYKKDFDKSEYYLSLLITTNDEIQEINREYRQKDAPTDVISFAYNETENIGAVNMLGDIVISIDRVNFIMFYVTECCICWDMTILRKKIRLL